jgi:hypothetical protein
VGPSDLLRPSRVQKNFSVCCEIVYPANSPQPPHCKTAFCWLFKIRFKILSVGFSKSETLLFRVHLRLVKAPRRVPCPMVGHLKHSFFGLSQPAREGHHVLCHSIELGLLPL